MLTQEAAIKIAQQVVQERYSLAPSVAQALLFSDKWINQHEGVLPGIELDLAREQYSGKWLVFFFCSWDTDQLGLPNSLMVLIDSNNGRPEIVPREREDWKEN